MAAVRGAVARARTSVPEPLFLLLVAAVAAGTLVANNPFAVPRIWFATTFIAFAAPFVLRRMKTSWGLVLIAVCGPTILSVMNELRYTETFDEFTDYVTLASPRRS